MLRIVRIAKCQNGGRKGAMKFYPPTRKRRGKYQGPLACTVQAKNIGFISGLFSPVPLHSQ